MDMTGYLISFALGATFGTGLIIAGCYAIFRAAANRWGGSQ